MSAVGVSRRTPRSTAASFFCCFCFCVCFLFLFSASMEGVAAFVAGLFGGPSPQGAPGASPLSEPPLPAGLRREGMLARGEARAFFARVEAALASPAGAAALRAAAAGGADPVAHVERLQSRAFVSLGVHPAHGAACLGRLLAEYAADEGFCREVYAHAAAEERACQLAEMPEEQAAALAGQQAQMAERWRAMGEGERRAALERQARAQRALAAMSPQQQQALMAQQQQAMAALVRRVQGKPPHEQQQEVMRHQEEQLARLLGEDAAQAQRGDAHAATAAPAQQTM